MLIIRNAMVARPGEAEGDFHDNSSWRESDPETGSRGDLHIPEIVCNLVLEQGKIVALLDDDPNTPSKATEFDATGLIATPGWMDIQLNGGFGYDFTEQPESIWDVGSRLPALGLTAFLPTIISSPLTNVERAIEIMQKGPPAGWKGAVPLGLHLEGPFLNPDKRGAHNPDYLQVPHYSVVRTWRRDRGVWLVTLAPELPKALETVEILRENGVAVSAGHSLATYEQAQMAFRAGITCVTHIFNAQPPLGHREPGLSGAALDSSQIFAGIIADGVHVHPAMVSFAWKCKRDRLILVTDAVSALGMPAGNYTVGDFNVVVDESSVRLADGTLAGSNVTPERCIQNLASWTGCSILDATAAMSRAPATFLGLLGRGEISPGADADLTLITPQGKVAATVVRGELLFNQRG